MAVKKADTKKSSKAAPRRLLRRRLPRRRSDRTPSEVNRRSLSRREVDSGVSEETVPREVFATSQERKQPGIPSGKALTSDQARRCLALGRDE